MKNQDTTMHQVAIFALCSSFFVLFASGDADADVSVCRHPTPVEKFTAAAYTALIVSNDPDFIRNFFIGGGEAGMHVYNVVKKILDEAKVCNAEKIAFVAGRGVAKAGNLTLPLLFKNTVYTVGAALYKGGVLDCANAIDLALQYFKYVQKEEEGQDKTQFDTILQSLLKGYADTLAAHNLKLGPVTTDAVNIFSSSFDDGSKPKCPYDDTEDSKKDAKEAGPQDKGPK